MHDMYKIINIYNMKILKIGDTTVEAEKTKP